MSHAVKCFGGPFDGLETHMRQSSRGAMLVIPIADGEIGREFFTSEEYVLTAPGRVEWVNHR